VKTLRKLIKYLLPFGAVEMARNGRSLREHGREDARSRLLADRLASA
jgi:hypothetical protein